MTLEQFADLMQGLGYKGEKGERVKVKAMPEVPVDAPAEAVAETAEVVPTEDAVVAEDTPTEDTPVEASDAAPTEAETPETSAANAGEAPDTAETAEAPEMEVFYTFTWAPRPRGGNRHGQVQSRGDGQQRQGGKPRGKGKPGQKGKGKPRRDEGAKTYSAKPKKQDKIDPDNPFAAALMGLKDKS